MSAHRDLATALLTALGRRRAPQPAPQRPCACGHDADAHEHYRPGSDCGICGTGQLDGCPRYRPA